MSLLEWFGESIDPGGTGVIEFGPRDRGKRPRIGVIICFAVACVMLGGWAYALWFWTEVRTPLAITVATAGTVAYLIVAYFVHPYADMDNIGMLGGLLDHPLRYSDDMNRLFGVIFLLLWPGRFVSESIVDMIRLLKHARQ